MKKYYCTETDELVDFGDVLHLTFHKEIEDGKVIVEKDVVFTEDTLDLMLGIGFVEEREEEDEEENNGLLDFDAPCEQLQGLLEDFEALKKRVEKLESLHAHKKKQ